MVPPRQRMSSNARWVADVMVVTVQKRSQMSISGDGLVLRAGCAICLSSAMPVDGLHNQGRRGWDSLIGALGWAGAPAPVLL